MIRVNPERKNYDQKWGTKIDKGGGVFSYRYSGLRSSTIDYDPIEAQATSIGFRLRSKFCDKS